MSIFRKGGPVFRAVLVSAVLIGLAAAAGARDEFPVSSLGDIWFQADYSGFRDPHGRVYHEYYLRITNNQLKFDPKGDEWVSRVKVKMEFLDENENKLSEAQQEFELGAATETIAVAKDRAKLLLLREGWNPQAVYVRIKLEDRNARKRGLLYMVTDKSKNGELLGRLDVPGHLSDNRALGVSDIQFAWAVEAAGGYADFEKYGLNVIPNPTRNYGRQKQTISAFFEIYDRAYPGHQQVFVINSRILNPAGEVVFTDADTLAVQDSSWAHVLRMDGKNLPAGEYSLQSRVWRFGSPDSTTVERMFGMVWGVAGWQRSEEDTQDEARVLLSEKEFNRFMEMSQADREVFLAEFWRDHDPTPDSPENELRQEFLARVELANQQFSGVRRKGMLTDRGRIFIRFGAPL